MNIPGVEVLYTSKYLYDTTWGWSPICIMWIIFIILGIIGIFIGCSDKDSQTIFVSSLIVVGCTILTLIFLASGKPVYGTEYHVTICDDVSFAKVANNYNVQEINGRLYTLRPHEIVPWEGD